MIVLHADTPADMLEAIRKFVQDEQRKLMQASQGETTHRARDNAATKSLAMRELDTALEAVTILRKPGGDYAGGEAAIAIGEHAFRAAFEAGMEYADTGLLDVDAAWLAYEPSEAVKVLS